MILYLYYTNEVYYIKQSNQVDLQSQPNQIDLTGCNCHSRGSDAGFRFEGNKYVGIYVEVDLA